MGVQGTSFSIFVQWSELDQMIVVDFSLIGIGFWMELKGPNSSFLLNGAFISNLKIPISFFFFFLNASLQMFPFELVPFHEIISHARILFTLLFNVCQFCANCIIFEN